MQIAILNTLLLITELQAGRSLSSHRPNMLKDSSVKNKVSAQTGFYLSVKRSGHKPNTELLQLLKFGSMSLQGELSSSAPTLSQSFLTAQNSSIPFHVTVAPRTTLESPQ